MNLRKTVPWAFFAPANLFIFLLINVCSVSEVWLLWIVRSADQPELLQANAWNLSKVFVGDAMAACLLTNLVCHFGRLEMAPWLKAFFIWVAFGVLIPVVSATLIALGAFTLEWSIMVLAFFAAFFAMVGSVPALSAGLLIYYLAALMLPRTWCASSAARRSSG